MGRFTVYDDNKIDEAINNDLKIIIECITSKIKVKAIILGGGFGRGEGGVLIDGKKISPVNDYDLFLIVSDDFEDDLRHLSAKLARKIGIRLIDLITIKESLLSELPNSQIFYDLKYGGQVLWGNNVLKEINEFKHGNIEISSAKTLLLNRLICAIEAYSEKYKNRILTNEEKFFIVNQTSKVILACVEALLIINKKYHHMYAERKKIFSNEFSNLFALNELNEIATQFKLKPVRAFNFNPLEYWNKSIKEFTDLLCEQLAGSKNKLWSMIKNSKVSDSITNHPIERVELMILLYKQSWPIKKRMILKRANLEINAITRENTAFSNWESLREKTAQLWHILYH